MKGGVLERGIFLIPAQVFAVTMLRDKTTTKHNKYRSSSFLQLSTFLEPCTNLEKK
jgi:hypothetical protein